MSFAAIGRELGLSEGACRMRFMRGLRDLREEFEKEGLEP
jgi:DNA-directed RNA polymerase specialized sigma24 family protein